MLDVEKLGNFVDQCWGDAVVPTLVEYIKIPNKSPAFDPDWAAHGYMEEAIALFEGWARERIALLPGATIEIVRLPGRTPLILIEVPGVGPGTVLLYGHLDKQPEMVGWADGYGPWSPRLDGDKLYGRGGADDGYAMFGALAALSALREQRVPHARCVVVIEACEESGSYDLPFYIDHLAQRIGRPSLVICLDSGCGNYDQLWLTTSLRGIAAGTLSVAVLEEGVHSGDASGVVPSSFRILRQLLSRLEDEASGAVIPASLYAQIPAERLLQAQTRRRRARRHRLHKIPVCAGHPADVGRADRARAQPHLAAAARGHRHRRAAQAGRRRQCAAALYERQTEPAPAADARRRGRRRDAATPLPDGPALRARRSPSRRKPPRRDGMRRRWRRGSKPRWRAPPKRRSAGRPPIWARAGRSRSWRCSASAFRWRNSS